MPLTLHIFEDRYKQMIQECVQSGNPFGVVLIKEGVEASGPLPEPHRIGCVAEIAQVQTLNDGHMNIVAVGRDRFQILSLNYDRPYLQGKVEHYPLQIEPEQETKAVQQRLLPWLEEYLAILSAAGNVDFDITSLPQDAETMAYLAATLLQIPNEQKQSLLSTAEAHELLAKMHKIYRRELPVLRLLLQEDVALPMGSTLFSMN